MDADALGGCGDHGGRRTGHVDQGSDFVLTERFEGVELRPQETMAA